MVRGAGVPDARVEVIFFISESNSRAIAIASVSYHDTKYTQVENKLTSLAFAISLF
jgi:hypothetical protein